MMRLVPLATAPVAGGACGLAVAVAPWFAVPPLVIACVWMLSRRRTATYRALSPLRLFLPVFLIYNVISIRLAGTPTSVEQLMMVGLAAAAFAAGCAAVGRIRSAPRPRAPNASLSAPVPPLLALVIISGAVAAVLVGRSGVPLLAADPNAARVVFFPNGYVSTLFVVSCDAVLIAAVISSFSLRDLRMRMLMWSLAATSIGLLVVTADRGLVLGPLLIVGLYSQWRRPARTIVILAVAVAAFTTFSFAGYQRDLAAFGTSYDAQLESAGYGGELRFLAPALRYVAGTSETMDQTLAVFPRALPHPYGKVFFGPLLHQPSADLFLKDTFGLSYVGFGLALGSVNALYLDFGILGIVVGFLLFGSVSVVLFRCARDRGGRWVLGYCMWMSNLILSNYGHPFAYLAVIIIPVVVLALVRGREPASGAVPRAMAARAEPAVG